MTLATNKVAMPQPNKAVPSTEAIGKVTIANPAAPMSPATSHTPTPSMIRSFNNGITAFESLVERFEMAVTRFADANDKLSKTVGQ